MHDETLRAAQSEGMLAERRRAKLLLLEFDTKDFTGWAKQEIIDLAVSIHQQVVFPPRVPPRYEKGEEP